MGARAGGSLRGGVAADAEIRRGLARDEFGIVCQPQVSLRSGCIVGAEALVRWTAPEGVRMPATFVPAAEHSGLVMPLGARVLELAARRAAVLSQVSPRAPFVMWVNVSAHQVLESDVVGLAARMLDRTGTAPQHLGLEITETSLLIDEVRARSVLRELRELGLKVALDDFGIGYSSMLYVKQFEFDVLKLAREFVDDLPTNAIDRAIVRSIVAVAHAAGLETVAEGIETEDQLDAVRDAGCDLGQGFLLGRPMTAASLKSLLVTSLEHARP